MREYINPYGVKLAIENLNLIHPFTSYLIMTFQG